MKFIGRIQDDIMLRKENEIVIYGCGRTGKQIYQELKKRGLGEKVCAFCDENSDLYGKQIEGVLVMRLTEAVARYNEAAYLVASCCVKDMVIALQSMDVKNIHITRI